MENSRSFDTMDSMRGLLSIVVVLMHMYIEQTLQTYPFALSAYLGVDCFFVMSGFVIAHSSDARLAEGMSPWRFALARWIRLFPFVLLGTAIAVFVQATRWNGSGEGPSLKLVGMALAQCLLIPLPIPGSDVAFPLNMPAWSLSAELIVNVVFALFWRPLRRWLTPVLGVLGVILLLVIRHNLDSDIGVEFEEFPGGLARAFFGFFAGVWLRRHYRGKYRVSTGLAFALTPLTFALMAIKLPEDAAFYYDSTCCLFVLPGVIALSAHLEAGERARRFFRRAGATCYGVYALHYPLGGLFRPLVPYVEKGPLRFVALGAIVIGLPVLTDFIVRYFDTPLRRALTRRLLGGRPARAASVETGYSADAAAVSTGDPSASS